MKLPRKLTRQEIEEASEELLEKHRQYLQDWIEEEERQRAANSLERKRS